MTGRSLNKFAWMEALRGADLSHAEYRILLNLSTWANGDLTNAYPGMKALAEAAQVSPPTLKKALRTLTAKGWIVLVDPGGNQYWKGKANVYSLAVPKGVTGLSPSGSQGGKPFSEGGNSVSEGGKSAPGEGDNSVIPHQELLPGDSTNASDQAAVVALADAGARGRVAEQSPAEVIAAEVVEETVHAHGFEAIFTPSAAAPVEPAPSVPAPVAEFGSDPAANPLAWLDSQLPGGFLAGERAKAQQMLDAGDHYTSVRWAVLRGRQKPKPKLPSSRRRAYIDDSKSA
ncbi:MarR family winged helix-turn-helix transcriptional regulator [Nocardia transvalensis]|uniref:MarR family winged helix-turn-helix transcriptional regulator n=1 Tax=Nocardia transvalensis TaxID=37333 RepID=UPI0018956632|nr:GntR family transcriptional regulator [Nocardia transvalensis]MBF6330260.1 GntR family transcriptional regulator [Nocardia transvalensis]